MCISTSTPAERAVAMPQDIEATKTTQRRVTFGYVEECDACEHHHFTEEQMATMWYNKNDLKGFRQHSKKILKDICSMDQFDCYRGLEVFENNNRSQRYSTCVLPVLQLQEDLWGMGVEDPVGLQSYANSLNRKSVEAAVKRGLQDSVEACKVFQESFESSTVESFFDELTVCTCQSGNDATASPEEMVAHAA